MLLDKYCAPHQPTTAGLSSGSGAPQFMLINMRPASSAKDWDGAGVGSEGKAGPGNTERDGEKNDGNPVASVAIQNRKCENVRAQKTEVYFQIKLLFVPY